MASMNESPYLGGPHPKPKASKDVAPKSLTGQIEESQNQSNGMALEGVRRDYSHNRKNDSQKYPMLQESAASPGCPRGDGGLPA